MTSPIVTIVVGHDARLFAAHEDVLSASPFFSAIMRGQFLESHSKRVTLPDEVPEIFSSVLEYLYKGDYYPRLLHNKRQDRWELEDVSPTSPAAGARGQVESTVYSPVDGQMLLKDTLLYCTAEKYGLDELKRLALRKQGLQNGIQCATILASARFAYANTPDSDSKLRAHYLALIIRSRATFKRSGTMQMEMERGGKLYVLCISCFPANTSVGLSYSRDTIGSSTSSAPSQTTSTTWPPSPSHHAHLVNYPFATKSIRSFSLSPLSISTNGLFHLSFFCPLQRPSVNYSVQGEIPDRTDGSTRAFFSPKPRLGDFSHLCTINFVAVAFPCSEPSRCRRSEGVGVKSWCLLTGSQFYFTATI